MATTITEFEDYKIVNAHIRLYDETGTLGESRELGCTGTLTTETELKTIQKICSGEVKKEVTKAVKLNGSLSAHFKQDVLIDVLGLTNDGLKPGVYGFKGQKSPRGIITFEVLDMYEEQKKFLGYPSITIGSGLAINIESGQEEIAMTELEFSAFRDENGYFYYQAFEKDLKDEDVKSQWHEALTPELVAATVVGG